MELAYSHYVDAETPARIVFIKQIFMNANRGPNDYHWPCYRTVQNLPERVLKFVQ
jgi:hypothetical protein